MNIYTERNRVDVKQYSKQFNKYTNSIVDSDIKTTEDKSAFEFIKAMLVLTNEDLQENEANYLTIEIANNVLWLSFAFIGQINGSMSYGTLKTIEAHYYTLEQQYEAIQNIIERSQQYE